MATRTAPKPPTSGSQTITEQDHHNTAENDNSTPTVLSIKLKPQKQRRGVKWTEETVDNEHLNKKKSKKCCVYHKPKKFGESDSESESDDEHHHHDESCENHVPVQKM